MCRRRITAVTGQLEGQTAQEIAQRYGVAVDTILETGWNRLTSADADTPLAVGRRCAGAARRGG